MTDRVGRLPVNQWAFGRHMRSEEAWVVWDYRFAERLLQKGVLEWRGFEPSLTASVTIDRHGAATSNDPLDRLIFGLPCNPKTVLRLLDRIKRKKGVWWMPWR